MHSRYSVNLYKVTACMNVWKKGEKERRERDREKEMTLRLLYRHTFHNALCKLSGFLRSHTHTYTQTKYNDIFKVIKTK